MNGYQGIPSVRVGIHGRVKGQARLGIMHTQTIVILSTCLMASRVVVAAVVGDVVPLAAIRRHGHHCGQVSRNWFG